MTSEDLDEVLRKKGAETEQLQQSLVQAASLGQELLAENDRLKELLAKRPSSPDRHTRFSLPQPPTRFRISTTDEAGLVFRHRLNSSPTNRTPHTPRKMGTVTWTDQWEDEMRDRGQLEDEHRLLQKRFAELETELRKKSQEDMQKVRSSSDCTYAMSWSRTPRTGTPCPGTPRKVRIEQALEAAEPEEPMQPSSTARSMREGERQAGGGLQDDLDDLLRARDSAEVRMQELRGELLAQAQQLNTSQKQTSELQGEMDACREHLANAEHIISQYAQAQEQAAFQQSARRMRRGSLGEMSRVSSIVTNVNSTASALGSKSQGFRSRRVSLLDEVNQLESMEQLQLEKAELAEEVDRLHGQLQKARETTPRMVRQPSADAGAGAEVMGFPADEFPSPVHSAEVIRTLQLELQQARREAAEADARLRTQERRHEQVGQLTDADVGEAEAGQHEEEQADAQAEDQWDWPDLWGWSVGRAQRLLCCSRPERRDPRRSFPEQAEWSS